jgi:hypothetical protein
MQRIGWIAFIAITLTACSEAPIGLEQVIDRNTKAVGGYAAIESVKSIEIDLHIADPGFEVDGTYRAARPGQMRIDIQAGGKHVFTEAFDGQKGWQSHDEGGKEAASPKGSAALRHGVELPGKLFGLHELKQRGHQLELVGREKIEGVNYHALRLTLSDGYTTTLYIDPASWLINRRRDVRPLHVDIDPTPTMIEQRSSDFREIAGVQFAFASDDVDLKTGKTIETVRVKRIKVNPPIDPSIFQNCRELRPLLSRGGLGAFFAKRRPRSLWKVRNSTLPLRGSRSFLDVSTSGQALLA